MIGISPRQSVAIATLSAIALLSCSHPPPEAEQPPAEYCRQLDDEPAGCAKEEWCSVASVTEYRLPGDGTCEPLQSAELCLRLREKKEPGQVSFPEVTWHTDADGNVMAVGSNPGFEDLEPCLSTCAPCVTASE